MATKVYTDQLLLSKDGHAHFFVSPQILGLILQSQLASPQISELCQSEIAN
jgi:hypothetical protein